MMEPLQENGDDTENEPDDSSDNLGYLINVVYRPFIEEKVRANDILSRMPCLRDFASKIFSISISTPNLAIKALLDHLKDDVEGPGKYQEFKDALKDARYEIIYQALEGQSVGNDSEHVKIMGLFSNKIQETIDANLLAQELFSESVINDEMRQRVQTCYLNKSPLDAAFILLDSIHRLKQDWFHVFLRVLYTNGHRNLVKVLDDKYFDKLECQEGHRDTDLQGESKSENASQLEETRGDEDEDHSSSPSVNKEIDRNQEINRSSIDGSRIPERLNSAASTEYLTNVSAIETLTENTEQLLLLVKGIDAKIDRLEGKVDHLYNTLNIPRH
ncbi:unnamed protein product [Lymnaea stagnalis]|uniref:Caspase recruitment domain-containing protein n=1 Tax=Lymnaea stagnalis TaxID=6523 RepID=A0AAV2IB11_LYMST